MLKAPPKPPARGRHGVFKELPKESEAFFKFWLIDINLFDGVLVCPLSELRRFNLPFDVNVLLGAYMNRQIYLKNMSDVRTFFHEASRHVVAYFALNCAACMCRIFIAMSTATLLTKRWPT
jgi:hypothetical protein